MIDTVCCEGLFNNKWNK